MDITNSIAHMQWALSGSRFSKLLMSTIARMNSAVTTFTDIAVYMNLDDPYHFQTYLKHEIVTYTVKLRHLYNTLYNL